MRIAAVHRSIIDLSMSGLLHLYPCAYPRHSHICNIQCKCIDPKNLGEPPKDPCGAPDYKGDGVCDDDNNNKGCDYDGGDCCAKTVKGGKVDKAYCEEVGSRVHGSAVTCIC